MNLSVCGGQSQQRLPWQQQPLRPPANERPRRPAFDFSHFRAHRFKKWLDAASFPHQARPDGRRSRLRKKSCVFAWGQTQTCWARTSVKCAEVASLKRRRLTLFMWIEKRNSAHRWGEPVNARATSGCVRACVRTWQSVRHGAAAEGMAMGEAAGLCNEEGRSNKDVQRIESEGYAAVTRH